MGSNMEGMAGAFRYMGVVLRARAPPRRRDEHRDARGARGWSAPGRSESASARACPLEQPACQGSRVVQVGEIPSRKSVQKCPRLSADMSGHFWTLHLGRLEGVPPASYARSPTRAWRRSTSPTTAATLVARRRASSSNETRRRTKTRPSDYTRRSSEDPSRLSDHGIRVPCSTSTRLLVAGRRSLGHRRRPTCQDPAGL